ncbi:CamS family sex pheromone protein [Virgibacillus kimchii]
MKKTGIWLTAFLFIILTGCLPQQDTEEEVVQNESEQETSLVPSHRLDEENYRMIIPYRPSEARGVITNQVANRLDIDELEEGLMRHSKDVFEPEEYLFQEGQYLTSSMVYDWLGRSLTEEELEREVEREIARLEEEEMTVNEDQIRENLQQGLNPAIEDTEDMDVDDAIERHEESPRYLSHILEQNFLQRTDGDSVELAGMSIGIAMKSVYRYQLETGGTYYYEDISESEMLEQGEEIAQEILNRVREIEGLENVPVMLAIYREAEQSSPVPGNFVAKTTVDGGVNSIGDWDSISDEYILFPSDEGRENYFDDHEVISSFGEEIAQFFPNYVGIIGEGFYIDEELQRLSIEIPLEFYGKAEVVGFTQFAYGQVQDMFANYFELEIRVTSSNKVESLIYRPANAESPTVHIFH